LMKSDDYHIQYEENRIWETTTWFGVPAWKLPLDAWIIQELIWKVKPKLIIETGSGKGGSALFYASLMFCMREEPTEIPLVADTSRSESFVISIDKAPVDIHNFKNVNPVILQKIIFFSKNSVDPMTVEFAEKYVRHSSPVMIMLDSWHSKEHVLEEMRLYAPFVSVGSYLIVEDTHVGGNPVPWDYGEGPMGAVKEFLLENNNFVIDKSCERLGMTFNPGGYLKKVRNIV